MKFGVAFANVGPMAHPEGAIALAQAAEASGFESLWTVEHTVVPAGYQSAYPYSDTGKMPGPEDSDIPDPAPTATSAAPSPGPSPPKARCPSWWAVTARPRRGGPAGSATASSPGAAATRS